MYCHKCGKEVTEGYDFCPFCGAKLKQPVELERVEVKSKKARDNQDLC